MGDDAELRGTTTLDGFRVLWVGIRREPWVFTLSTAGAVLFGALTVADAWVLGWATDHVVLPGVRGRRDRHRRAAARSSRCSSASRSCARSASSRAGSAPASCSTACRRTTAARVTRQYLALPMEWHQQHPTGQLLSNANSDVEAAWAPIAPLPMAVGTVAMMVIAVVQMLLADVVLARRRPAGLPGRDRSPTSLYQRLAVAADDPGPGAARRAQRGRARVLRRRAGRQDARAARPRRPSGSPPRPTSCATSTSAPAGSARPSTRCSRRCPASASWSCWPSASPACSSGATDPGDVVTVAYLLTIVSFPIRSIGWLLGEFPRSVVGLPPGAARCSTPPARCRTATARVAAPATGRPARRRATSAYRYDRRRRRCCDDVDVHRRARPHRRRGRRHGLRQEHADHAADCGWSTPTTGAVLLDGIDLRDLAPGALAARRRRSCRSRRSCSTTPSAATSPSAPTCPTTRCGPRCAPPRPTASSPPCPTASTPGSGSAAPRCPAASASGSRWPGRWCAARGCWSWTTPPRRSTPRSRRASSPRCADRPSGRLDASLSWSPTARPRSRWPTRSCTSRTAGSSTRAPTPSCWPATPATPTWSTPTSRGTPTRAGEVSVR